MIYNNVLPLPLTGRIRVNPIISNIGDIQKRYKTTKKYEMRNASERNPYNDNGFQQYTDPRIVNQTPIMKNQKSYTVVPNGQLSPDIFKTEIDNELKKQEEEIQKSDFLNILFKIFIKNDYNTLKDKTNFIKDKINEILKIKRINDNDKSYYYFNIFDMNDERLNKLKSLYPNTDFITFFDLFLQILFYHYIKDGSEINLPETMKNNNSSTLINRINQLNQNIKDPFFKEYLEYI